MNDCCQTALNACALALIEDSYWLVYEGEYFKKLVEKEEE